MKTYQKVMTVLMAAGVVMASSSATLPSIKATTPSSSDDQGQSRPIRPYCPEVKIQMLEARLEQPSQAAIPSDTVKN
jgi:hypothetical protein